MNGLCLVIRVNRSVCFALSLKKERIKCVRSDCVIASPERLDVTFEGMQEECFHQTALTRPVRSYVQHPPWQKGFVICLSLFPSCPNDYVGLCAVKRYDNLNRK